MRPNIRDMIAEEMWIQENMHNQSIDKIIISERSYQELKKYSGMNNISYDQWAYSHKNLIRANLISSSE